MLFGLTENGFTSLTSFGKDSKKEVGSLVEVQCKKAIQDIFKN
jgi:hypothetical protein